MTGLLRKAMLFACTGVFAASSAMAAVPSPADSDVPCGLNLVGTTGGVADAKGSFTITVRDLAHNPIAGSSVVIDFSGCSVDIRVCSVQPTAGVTADCSGTVGSISGVTDGSGSIVMKIVGGARNTASHTPGSPFKCATVYADGVNMGKINVGAYDENGAGGVNPADISVWLPDSFDYPATYRGRSDFNCTQSINPADLSLLLATSLGGASFNSCSAYCH